MVEERKNLDEEYKWDLTDLFESDEKWEEELERVSRKVTRLDDFKGCVTDSPENLFEILKLKEGLERSLSDLNAYAGRRYDENTRKSDYQGMKSRASSLSSKVSSKLSFLRPEIQDAGKERIDELIDRDERLEVYRHFFKDVLRFKPHTRSQEIENVLADLGDVLDAPDSGYKALMNADISFPVVERPDGEEIEITQGNFTNLLKNRDRGFRGKVHEEFYSEIGEVENTVAVNFEKNIRRNVKLAGIKDFETARKASLFSSNIPVDVYDSLVDTVEDNLDVLHDHLELKKDVLGVENLRPEDLYMPLAQSKDLEISYEEAREYILEALRPLGGDYVETVRDGLDSGWVDVYENKGKRSGAYSSSTYDSHPYILMNYQGDVSSMYTLAHELGHAMHSHYSVENQPFVYSDYSIFVAEVASTVNEALLTRYLLENAEDQELKRHVLSHYLEGFRNTLFRQTMFASFERQVHEQVESGEALTSGSLTEDYADLKETYLGPVELDGYIGMEWMRIPHFYYNFYVFQYSTGVSAAETLAEKILTEGPEDYIEFLSMGSRKYPVEALKIAGIDMESSEPVKQAIEKYRQHVREAEEIFT